MGQEIDKLAAEFALANNHRVLLFGILKRMERRTYLWWNLVRDDLQRACEDSWCPNEGSVNALVYNLPVFVEHTYECMLQRLTKEASQKARMIFLVILEACRPMWIGEIVQVLEAVPSSSQRNSSTFRIDEDQLENRIRAWCGICVFVDHSRL